MFPWRNKYGGLHRFGLHVNIFFYIFKKSVTSTPLKFTPADDMMDFMAVVKSEVSQHIFL